MITRYIKGDITETELKYIAHGVNCQDKMGSGVAKALYEKFPEVKEEYHKYNSLNTVPENRLGECYLVASGDKLIFNLYTQLNYGYDGKKYVNYNATIKSLEMILYYLNLWKVPSELKILGIPKIGCGLAGGNWEFMEQLINDTVGDDLEIWVYEL